MALGLALLVRLYHVWSHDRTLRDMLCAGHAIKLSFKRGLGFMNYVALPPLCSSSMFFQLLKSEALVA